LDEFSKKNQDKKKKKKSHTETKTKQMKQLLVIVCICLTLLLPVNVVGAAAPSCNASDRIKHLVVLMLENRSFDHMLGYLNVLNPEINGVSPSTFNYLDPLSPSESTKVFSSHEAPYVDPDLSHSVQGTSQEVQWGSSNNDVSEALMNGFAAQAESEEKGWGSFALASFNHTSVPVISTLATQFAVFDRYFAGVPGPTEVNRLFAMSGTSHGYATNNRLEIAEGFPQESMFDRLDEASVEWNVYMEQISSTLALRHNRRLANLKRHFFYESFAKHLDEGTLPSLSWIEPAYFGIRDVEVPRDQHPSHNVVYGEELIRDIYGKLRNSAYWNCSALVVTYDEHGGYHDSVPTPLKGVPNPDGRVSENPPFAFDRLGVRVPFVVASPWIDANTVVHGPAADNKPTPYSEFEHSSIPKTVAALFGARTQPPLTNRTAFASDFSVVWRLSNRTEPRTDCPSQLPKPPHAKAFPFYADKDRYYAASLPLTGLQKSFVMLARSVCGQDSQIDLALLDTWHQHDAGIYVKKCMRHAIGQSE
jgi:phospholipase C